MLSAILIAQQGSAGPLRGLVERLASTQVAVAIVDDLPTAHGMCEDADSPPVILLDLRDAGAGELEDVHLATAAIKKTIALMPEIQPVVVTAHASAALVLACLRAGAGDLIDLAHEGTGTAHAIVQRLHGRQAEQATAARTLRALRAIVEELVKDLVRTERRSIDLEDKLSRRTTDGGEPRAPTVLLIEHDRAVADELAERLENAGVATYAYATGEEALREIGMFTHTGGPDLALVAAQLPGMDGLQTIRRLREHVAGLPAFLVTSVHDAALAEDAADLGVVGFVHKPLGAIDEVVARLAQLTTESFQRNREHSLLQRIKDRHEAVLAKYRSLPREP